MFKQELYKFVAGELRLMNKFEGMYCWRGEIKTE